MIREPFYDPEKSYYDNYESGPFGAFAEAKVYEDHGEPAREFCGHKIHAPFGIPAGPLLNSKFVIGALDKGFDLPVYKTVRSGVRQSHPAPNVLPVDLEGDLTLDKAAKGLVTKSEYTDPLSITNSFGVPSFEPEVWQPDAAKAIKHARPGQLVGVSFEGTRWKGASDEEYINDWVDTAKLVADTGPGFMEANLSCPNEGTTALLCFDIDKVDQIAGKIKEAVGDTPLFLKISYFSDFELLELLVDRLGDKVDGFSTINTLSAEVRTPDGEQALPGEGRLRSGICGHAIRWAGLDMVSRFAKFRLEKNMRYKIVGVGGVTEPADYHAYVEAGADAVMSATGAMWNPYLAKEIKKELAV